MFVYIRYFKEAGDDGSIVSRCCMLCYAMLLLNSMYFLLNQMGHH